MRKSILVADAFVSTFSKYLLRLVLYSSMLKFLYAHLSQKISLNFGSVRQLSRAYRTSRCKQVSFSFGMRSSLATYRSTSETEVLKQMDPPCLSISIGRYYSICQSKPWITMPIANSVKSKSNIYKKILLRKKPTTKGNLWKTV